MEYAQSVLFPRITVSISCPSFQPIKTTGCRRRLLSTRSYTAKGFEVSFFQVFLGRKNEITVHVISFQFQDFFSNVYRFSFSANVLCESLPRLPCILNTHLLRRFPISTSAGSSVVRSVFKFLNGLHKYTGMLKPPPEETAPPLPPEWGLLLVQIRCIHSECSCYSSWLTGPCVSMFPNDDRSRSGLT